MPVFRPSPFRPSAGDLTPARGPRITSEGPTQALLDMGSEAPPRPNLSLLESWQTAAGDRYSVTTTTVDDGSIVETQTPINRVSAREQQAVPTPTEPEPVTPQAPQGTGPEDETTSVGQGTAAAAGSGGTTSTITPSTGGSLQDVLEDMLKNL